MRKILIILSLIVSLNCQAKMTKETKIKGGLIIAFVGSNIITGGATAYIAFGINAGVWIYYKIKDIKSDKMSGMYATRKQNRFKNRVLN